MILIFTMTKKTTDRYNINKPWFSAEVGKLNSAEEGGQVTIIKGQTCPQQGNQSCQTPIQRQSDKLEEHVSSNDCSSTWKKIGHPDPVTRRLASPCQTTRSRQRLRWPHLPFPPSLIKKSSISLSQHTVPAHFISLIINQVSKRNLLPEWLNTDSPDLCGTVKVIQQYHNTITKALQDPL